MIYHYIDIRIVGKADALESEYCTSDNHLKSVIRYMA